MKVFGFVLFILTLLSGVRALSQSKYYTLDGGASTDPRLLEIEDLRDTLSVKIWSAKSIRGGVLRKPVSAYLDESAQVFLMSEKNISNSKEQSYLIVERTVDSRINLQPKEPEMRPHELIQFILWEKDGRAVGQVTIGVRKFTLKELSEDELPIFK